MPKNKKTPPHDDVMQLIRQGNLNTSRSSHLVFESFLEAFTNLDARLTALEPTRSKLHETIVKYRVYADESVVREELFNDVDNTAPYTDDYYTVEIPWVVVEHIQDSI